MQEDQGHPRGEEQSTTYLFTASCPKGSCPSRDVRVVAPTFIGPVGALGYLAIEPKCSHGAMTLTPKT